LFWFVPADREATSDECTNDSADNSISMPPAHRQLLSDDLVTFATLKGYDHTLALPYNNNNNNNNNNNHNNVGYCRRTTVPSVKQRGGGSWLLSFARPNDGTIPGEDDLPELVHDDSSLTDDEPALVTGSAADPPGKRGVSFAADVRVQPVPHSSTLEPRQRWNMYSTSIEVRRNKQRNKMEYRYDGCDWRNATEECEMGGDVETSELVHPVHDLL